VDGVVDGVLRCRVTAPPVEGAANVALLRLLARDLGVPRSSLRIASGEAARRKVVEATGPAGSAVLARWPDLAV
jgi:uncharacterized protein YggU (UPF0235/DUF167 family)